MNIIPIVVVTIVILNCFHTSFANTPPNEWKSLIASGDLLYSSSPPPAAISDRERAWPPISNGFVGVVAECDKLFVRGVFNGKLWSPQMKTFEHLSHGAVIAPLHLFSLENAEPIAWAFDLRNATYITRLRIGTSTIERSFFAHRTNRNLLVETISLIDGPSAMIKPIFAVNQTFPFKVCYYFSY
jgi:hypothetical protein